MKEARICIIATIITAIIICSCAYAMPAKAEAARPEFYPKLTVVFETEKVSDYWIISCVDKSQNVWTFYDDEGTWEKGDIANLLMWTTGENEEDDEIIEVYWEGYIENINLFFQINGWR